MQKNACLYFYFYIFACTINKLRLLKMEKTCKNCGQSASGNFCSNCGQNTHSGRIDLHHLTHDFLHGVLHVDKGIFYSIKELLLRPGSTIRGYLGGKRIKHFKPFAFIFILATIYGFLLHFFHFSFGYEDIIAIESESAQGSELGKDWTKPIADYIEKHYAIATLLKTPIYTLTSFLFFKKSKYNYGEHLVINAYTLGLTFAIRILLFFPLVYLTNNSDWSVNLLTAIDFLLISYVYFNVFNVYSKGTRIVRIIGSYVSTLFIIMVLFIIIIIFALLLTGII